MDNFKLQTLLHELNKYNIGDKYRVIDNWKNTKYITKDEHFHLLQHLMLNIK